MQPRLALVGPTAAGKTEAALHLAEGLGAQIVSADSMLVYRGMDIGTAKPTAAQRERIAHHGMDLADPREPYSVALYQHAAKEAVEQIQAAGDRVLIVGGSGLYYRALVDDLAFPPTDPAIRTDLDIEVRAIGVASLRSRLVEIDPEAASKIEPDDRRRTVRALEVIALTGRPFSSFADAWEHYDPYRVRAAGLAVPSEILAHRIEARVDAMLAEGFIDEVQRLIDQGSRAWLTSTQAIGYAEVARYLEGEGTLDEARAATVKRTRALARRQMAWFRRDPRVRWFPAPEGAEAIVDELMEYLAV